MAVSNASTTGFIIGVVATTSRNSHPNTDTRKDPASTGTTGREFPILEIEIARLGNANGLRHATPQS